MDNFFLSSFQILYKDHVFHNKKKMIVIDMDVMWFFLQKEYLNLLIYFCYLGQKVVGKCLQLFICVFGPKQFHFAIGFELSQYCRLQITISTRCHQTTDKSSSNALHIFKQLLKTFKTPLFSIPWYHTKHSECEELVRKCILHKVLAPYITSEGLYGSFGFI